MMMMMMMMMRWRNSTTFGPSRQDLELVSSSCETDIVNVLTPRLAGRFQLNSTQSHTMYVSQTNSDAG